MDVFTHMSGGVCWLALGQAGCWVGVFGHFLLHQAFMEGGNMGRKPRWEDHPHGLSVAEMLCKSIYQEEHGSDL